MRRVIVLALLLTGTALAQTPGAVFRDCADCPEMVSIPAGRFLMGSPEGGMFDELPQRAVTVPAFALGRTPVTARQFAQFRAETGYRAAFECAWFSGTRDANGGLESRIVRNDAAWSEPTHPPDAPVVCISRRDAEAYVRWLSQRSGQAYRLPSEAEWEYAARAGTTGDRWWGDDPAAICQHANVVDRTLERTPGWRQLPTSPFPIRVAACEDGHATVAPVAQLRPNPFGLYDMLGNVSQWVADCYVDSYASAPTDGSARKDDPNNLDCDFGVLRGGTWLNEEGHARAPARSPADAAGDIRLNLQGFRVARSLSP